MVGKDLVGGTWRAKNGSVSKKQILKLWMLLGTRYYEEEEARALRYAIKKLLGVQQWRQAMDIIDSW